MLGVSGGQLRDLQRTFGPLESERGVLLQEESMLAVNLVEQFRQREAERFRVRSDFRKNDSGAIAVFVADEIGGGVAIALLAAADVEAGVLEPERPRFSLGERPILGAHLGREGRFIFAQLFPDVLE